MQNLIRQHKQRLLLVMTSITAILLLAGCQDEPKNLEPIEESIEELEFRDVVVLLSYYPRYTITTDKQTIVWRSVPEENGDVELWASDDGDKITYDIDSDGEMYNRKIHLSPEGIKKYSKSYVNEFGENLKLKHSEQDKD